MKLIVSAPSNVAVDNILEKLVAVSSSTRVVRLGHPARLGEATKRHCLEHLVSHDENTEIVMDVRNDIDRVRRLAASKRSWPEKKALYSELKALRREAHKREEKVVQQIIKNSDVVLCTCVGASNRLLRDTVFDIAVIDEAAQALHVACWIPMLLAKKVIIDCITPQCNLFIFKPLFRWSSLAIITSCLRRSSRAPRRLEGSLRPSSRE